MTILQFRKRLVNKIAASTYFHLTEVPASYEEGLRNIELGTADIVMEILGIWSVTG